MTRSSRTWRPAGPSWSSRTATRSAPWSSTWTTSGTRRSPGWTSRPGCRWSTRWTPRSGPRPAAGATSTRRPRPRARPRSRTRAGEARRWSAVEAVAHARVGEQIARPGRLGLQLAAQLRHVHAQVVVLRLVGRAPDFVQQLPLGHQPTAVAHQHLEQLPLGGG